MPNIVIDEALNEFLGLPVSYQIDKKEAFKLFQYFRQLFPADVSVGRNHMEYYVDVHGDFVNDPKNRQDYVVKAIHENMPMADQFETLKYIEYYKETNGFTSME